MSKFQEPVLPEQPIESQYVCQECKIALTEDEALLVVQKEDAGEKHEKYLCKKCYERKTDARG